MKPKNNPTLSGDRIKGLSEETAGKLAETLGGSFERLRADIDEWSKMAHNAMEKALRQAKTEAYVMDLKLQGIRLSEQEHKVYKKVLSRVFFFELRERDRRKFIVPIQNIHLVNENLYICQYRFQFYWCFIDDRAESNLADIREYEKISKELYHQLSLKKFDYYDSKRLTQQERGLRFHYLPEDVTINNGEINFTEEDLQKLEAIQNESE